jgi:hypothetical protein
METSHFRFVGYSTFDHACLDSLDGVTTHRIVQGTLSEEVALYGSPPH